MPLQSGMKPLCKERLTACHTASQRRTYIPLKPEDKTDNKTVILMRIIRFSEMEY